VQKNTSTKSRLVGGFTIIELMLTVAIIAVISAFAIPQFSDFIQRQRVKTTTEVINQTVSEARSNALTQLADVTMCWNFTNVQVDVDSQAIPANSILVYIPASDDDAQMDLTLREISSGSTLVQDTDDDNCVSFDSQGRLDASSVSGDTLQFGVCRSGDGKLTNSLAINVR